jgi:DNA-directed RNA polymerase subunit F|tara:strand:+ start:114 stop:476 length:363 start_codon:yes stop_codon:yes gene_type:complete
MSEEEFVDVATVRDLLLDAQKRRGELSYEQTMALQHAEWAASVQGHPTGSLKTESKIFKALYEELMKNEKLVQYPEISAKIAELCPMSVADIRVVIASKRIAMDTSEIEALIDTIKQHVL